MFDGWTEREDPAPLLRRCLEGVTDTALVEDIRTYLGEKHVGR